MFPRGREMDELLLNTPEGRALIEHTRKTNAPAERREGGRVSRLHQAAPLADPRAVTMRGGLKVIEVPRQDREMQSAEGKMCVLKQQLR